jgi:hypothetical protein
MCGRSPVSFPPGSSQIAVQPEFDNILAAHLINDMAARQLEIPATAAI